MADSSSGADIAYDRAFAAFREGSYDVAYQWLREALTQDPSHARARALLPRLEAVRRTSRPGSAPPRPGVPPRPAASEVVSTDPTVLISRASLGPLTEPIDPTVMIRRDDGARRRPEGDPFAGLPSRPGPVAEPTVIVDRSQLPPLPPRTSPPPPRPPAGAAIGWRERWFGARAAAGGRSVSDGSLRGLGLVIGAIAAAALLLVAGIAAVRWFWPAGQLLTLTRPTGGTLIGPSLKCGTRNDDCTSARPTGDPVELTAEADDGYIFSGFTGDCAPAGRVAMTVPRTCGATFNKIEAPAAPVTFALTIVKPVGGTLLGAGDIVCGTMATRCSANLPSGAPVTLHPESDDGYTFNSFTGDCAPKGETTMTTGRTCGATFAPTAGSVANVVPDAVVRSPTSRQRAARPAAPAAPPAAAPAVAPPAAPPVSVPLPAPPAASDSSQATTTDKAAPPISAEDHAKKEIEQLVNNYCLAYESRDANKVRTLFPLAPMADLRQQFDEHRSLRCTITSPLKYDRLDASAAGGAQIEFGMKLQYVGKSGGTPEVAETIVTMVVSRQDFQSKWLIDRLKAVLKPKG